MAGIQDGMGMSDKINIVLKDKNGKVIDERGRPLIKENIHIVLRGADGQLKQELKPNKNSPKGVRKEFRNGT